ncbi:MAG TPA: hypothetical protein VJ844_01665, partial [Mucilaginibacter sp.]|nr:hypothetical protein [Mucilaginibacter sp.]
MRQAIRYKLILLILFTAIRGLTLAQVTTQADSVKRDSLRKVQKQKIADNINRQYDFGDLVRNLLHPGKKPDTLHHGSGITVVP